MRPAALLVCLCVVLAGCTANPGVDATTTERTTTTGDTTTPMTDQERRFDGEANADLTVYNPTNETWTATYTIERDGTVVLNKSTRVPGGDMWTVATIEEPGNYTFTVATGAWRDSTSVRLPRAVGDRKTYVEVAGEAGSFYLRVRWEQ